jgi:hypothetical protein
MAESDQLTLNSSVAPAGILAGRLPHEIPDRRCGLQGVIRVRSRSSRRMLPTKRSVIALALGARTGVLMMRISMAVKTASNAVVNLGPY